MLWTLFVTLMILWLLGLIGWVLWRVGHFRALDGNSAHTADNDRDAIVLPVALTLIKKHQSTLFESS